LWSSILCSPYSKESRRERPSSWRLVVVIDKRFNCSCLGPTQYLMTQWGLSWPVCNSSIIYCSGRSDCMSGKWLHMSVIGGIQSTLMLSVLVCPFYLNDCDASSFFLSDSLWSLHPSLRCMKDMVRLASIGHLCSSSRSIFIQVLHIGNLLTSAFSLGRVHCVRPKCGRRSRWFPFSLWALNKVAFSLNVQLAPAGLSASTSTACGGGSMGGLFSAHERASAIAPLWVIIIFNYQTRPLVNK